MQQKATGFIEVTLRETVSVIKDLLPDLSDDATLMIGSHGHRPTVLSEIVYGEYKHTDLTHAMTNGKSLLVIKLFMDCFGACFMLLCIFSIGIEQSYSAWQERMKLPMQLVRDPLDIDVPDLFPAHALLHAHANTPT
ncbi:hypothetical protein EON65_24890, partial [archaeon]